MSGAIFLQGLLAITSALLLLYPHFKKERLVTPLNSKNRYDALLEEKERLVQILRDLELDHNTQKVSDEEFERMNDELRSELVDTLKKIEESQ